jgi:hypothetical protein
LGKRCYVVNLLVFQGDDRSPRGPRLATLPGVSG